MIDSTKLKLVISYSHLDEEHVGKFTKHIAPLKNKGLISEWYDRKITPGKDFQEQIDTNLERKNGITVIPIILSPCGWLDDDDISLLLALPEDGQPISHFPDPDTAWNTVYDGLKRAIEDVITIRELKLTDDFVEFLNSSDLLSKAHSQKDRVYLDDIFIWPDLAKYDDLKDYEKTVK